MKYFFLEYCSFAVWLSIPWFSFFFSWLKYKSQSRCWFIVRPRYLTCFLPGIHCPLILKLSNYFVTITKKILSNNLYISSCRILCLKNPFFPIRTHFLCILHHINKGGSQENEKTIQVEWFICDVLQRNT